MKKELIKLANHLDSIGHGDLADKLDVILKSAQDGSELAEIGDEEGMSSVDMAVDIHTADDLPPPVDGFGEEVVNAPVDGFGEEVVNASSAQDRINKMAELMGREFNTYVPGTFSR